MIGKHSGASTNPQAYRNVKVVAQRHALNSLVFLYVFRAFATFLDFSFAIS